LLWRTADVSALAEKVRPSLALAAHDSPAIRGRKIRSLVDYGFLDDAAAALREIPVAALHDLPRDRDYLAVLAQLAQGSAATGSGDHCQALYELLRPYSHLYAVGISFHCEGSIATYLGGLARALGRDREAREHLEEGLERNRAFGLAPCAAQTKFELGELLLTSQSERDPVLARRLLDQTRAEAKRMGMQPLAAEAQRLLKPPP
jgi:hypothetical protein